MIRLRSHGRGHNYRLWRGVVESALHLLYAGDWPAALWAAVPGACAVDCLRHRVPLLAAGSAPVRVGFVSDLHLGPTTPRQLLDAAFGHLAGARLDVLLLGGDYVFLDATEAKASELGARIRQVPATRKLAVLGNHDLWTRHTLIERALADAGVELLINRSTTLAPIAPGLCIVGLDDPWTGDMDARQAFRGAEGAQGLLVLCHSPDGLPETRAMLARSLAGSPALYVCGHTHGGQVATPWGPLVVPGPAGRQYPAGMYRVGKDIDVHVSRGVGGVEVPVRTYARPDVVVFELTSRLEA